MLQLAWWWSLLLLPLPWLVKPTSDLKVPGHSAVILPFYDLLKQSLESPATHVKPIQVKNAVLLVIWCLLVVAAARPQWVGDPIHTKLSGRELMLAIDLSGSMSQKDMTINRQAVSRLQSVKAVVNQFIEQRKGDRIGLILFGSNAYVQSPLTFDTSTVKSYLSEAMIGLAGESTAIGDAIALGVKHFSANSSNKVMIMLTDGRNNAGNISIDQAIELSKEAGLTLYTIGFGADKAEMSTLLGNIQYNPSKDLDTGILKHMADETGGQFFRAKDQPSLQEVYAKIQALEPIDVDETWIRPTVEFYYWPLGAALFISLLAYLGLITKRILLVRRTDE